jgi:hypothetical protein
MMNASCISFCAHVVAATMCPVPRFPNCHLEKICLESETDGGHTVILSSTAQPFRSPWILIRQF